MGALGVVVALGVAAISFGPFVRSRVAKESERRGLVTTIGRVHAGWFAITLDDVTIKPEGTTALDARIAHVRIETTATMSVARLVISSPEIHLAENALDELAAWRERHTTSSEPSAHKTPLAVEHGTLAWRSAFGFDAIDATEVAVARDDSGFHATAASVTLANQAERVELGRASTTYADGKLQNAHIDSARIEAIFGVIEPPPPEPSLPPPPPSPPTKRGAKTAEPTVFHPIVPMPDLHIARALVQRLARRVADRTPEGFRLVIDAVTIAVERGKEKLELGPGSATFERRASELATDFSAGPSNVTGQTPLTLHASVPIDTGDTVVSLAGGPVTLSMLGVHDGAFGLVDPTRATLTGRARVLLDDEAKSLTFDGDIAANGLSIQNAKLADETVRGLDVRLSARGVLDDAGAIRLDDAEARLGALHLRAHGALEQTSEHLAASLSLELPVAGCQSLLESVPAALFPHISEARFRGTLGAKGFLSFDTRKIDDMVLKYDVDDLCRVTQVPEELKKDHFDGTFTYAIVDKDGKPAERETGAGSGEWAPLDTISPMMQVAVLTTEDGAFFHHHGFNEWAIRSALVADLKAGRFVRGASTISMQLAKNLFLSREKTVSRKLEELILTDYLERTFQKDEMMELYLNIIEFGPDIYGVRAAAQHYFGREPAELNLAECLFLSTLLPRPREYHKMYEKNDVPQSWMNTIHQLMEIAHKNGRISDPELEEAKSDAIVFHKEDTPLPVRRPPVRGAHFTGDDTWETN